MKENEAINVLNMIEAHGNLSVEAKAMSIKALEEVQQYRAIGTPEELKSLKENGAFTGMELAQLVAMQMSLREYEKIGTVEECRTAVKKQTARKVTTNHSWTHYHFFCPVCNMEVNDMKYCPNCGQKLDWGDEE